MIPAYLFGDVLKDEIISKTAKNYEIISILIMVIVCDSDNIRGLLHCLWHSFVSIS